MGRTAILAVTILSLAWQSFAAMAATVVPGGRSAVVHSVMHWQEIPHHHGHAHPQGPAPASGEESGSDEVGEDGHHDHDHHHAVADRESGETHGFGLAVHVDDSLESHGHLAAGHGSAPALLSDILTPPPVPGGITPGLSPAHPELPPLPDGLFRPPRTPA